ncbi:hypothetical protein G6F65_021197 [Rhizopus arrhizus]|nr:hypothetical protein G6F65_021197 [Rhizopus arrhizus]
MRPTRLSSPYSITANASRHIALIPRAHIDQAHRAHPRRVRRHHIDACGNELGRRIRQQGHHGQRVGCDERLDAAHAARLERQQQRQGQRRGQPPHQEEQGSRHGFCRVAPSGVCRRLELPLHWVRKWRRVTRQHF